MNKLKRTLQFISDFVFYIRERFTIKEAWRLAMITKDKRL